MIESKPKILQSLTDAMARARAVREAAQRAARPELGDGATPRPDDTAVPVRPAKPRP